MHSGLLAEGTRWETPYYRVEASHDGPTLLVVGGIHGNEPAGWRTAEQVRHWPIVAGVLVVVPQANVPGIEANTRLMPDVPGERANLNRNFPDEETNDSARGEIAQALWQFVQEIEPDWILDLHEGHHFNRSHQPPEGEERSVGSSVIYRTNPALDELARRMQEAANSTVTDPKRRFVLLDRGPKKTSLVSACIRQLGIPGMILETTFRFQPISLRTRQHRLMVNVIMRHLGMLERDCADVLAAPKHDRMIHVALYDGPGASSRGVARLARVVAGAENMTLNHLGPADVRPVVLQQFDVIIFPGGSGSKQAAGIAAAGRKHVRGFVHSGGGYLGVCAGAYLASAHYTWSLDLVPTSVFTGAREIEGVGTKQMWYRGKETTVSMELTDEGRELFADLPGTVDVMYQNGPIVSPKDEADLAPYTTLAHFRTENVLYEPQRGTMVDTPAIVAGHFGRGRAIAVSPHPEATEALHSIISQSIRWTAGRIEP